jgi:hypothetical protein
MGGDFLVPETSFPQWKTWMAGFLVYLPTFGA